MRKCVRRSSFQLFFMNIRFAGDLIEHSNGDEAKGEGRDRREVNN